MTAFQVGDTVRVTRHFTYYGRCHLGSEAVVVKVIQYPPGYVEGDCIVEARTISRTKPTGDRIPFSAGVLTKVSDLPEVEQ